MKKLNLYSNHLIIMLVMGLFPFISLGNNGDPENDPETKSQPSVSNVKKMTRYSLAFDIDLPSLEDVYMYISEDLGIEVQEVEGLNDPNWNPSTLDTRNFRVAKNEEGLYEVQIRFYPPLDPMSVENLGSVQKDSRMLCTETIDLLKSSQSK